MRRIVTSSTAATRLEHARRWLAAQASDATLLVIASTLDAGSILLREALGTRSAALGWERTTPDLLLQRLCVEPLATRGLAVAPPLALEAVTRRAVAQVHAARGLGRFAAVAERDGLAKCLTRTLQELALARIEPASVAGVVPELAALQRAFASELGEAALADRARLCAMAIEVVERSAHPLVGVPVLIVDLELETPLERALYAALMRASSNALCVAPNTPTPPVDPAVAGATLVSSQPDSTLYDDALQRLQAHLFEANAPRAEIGDEVVVLSAPGEGRECVEIARRLLWAAEGGLPFERMAVLLRSPTQYRAHLVEALRRAGIPARFSAGTVRPDPAGRALLALLRCKVERLSVRAFAEYLSLNVVPAPNEPIESESEVPPTPPTPRQWERLLNRAAVVGGRERWQRRLSGLAEQLALNLSALADDQDRHHEAITSQVHAVRALQAFALPLLDMLEALPEQASWATWIAALNALARRSLAQPRRVLEVLAELTPLGELGPVTLDDVMGTLRPRLLELRVHASEDAGGSVFVGSIDDARGRSFELVCIPGLAERVFPEKLRQDPILRDDERARIDAALTTDADRVERERRFLTLAVGAATRRVVLSYPRIDTDKARPRVPSFYCLEVLRAAQGYLPGYDELMRRAEGAADARIGWPAPRLASDAIDPAEHDLAQLQRVLTGDDAESVGAMHYLLGANPHLARSLRFRARRWETPRWTSADGLVAPTPGAQAALAKHRLAARAYSASSLQHYAACPYRFLLSAVHGLAPRKTAETTEEIDPLQRGSIVHDTQFAVLSALREAGSLPLTAERLPAAVEQLDAALQRVERDYHDRLVPAIERVWRDGIAAIRADLRAWLERSIQTHEDSWVPRHFELGFGVPMVAHADPRSTSTDVKLANGVRLRGSIDLVEARGSALRATDHKTGTPPEQESFIIDGGHLLQPALYALALEGLFPSMEVSEGRLYFCTARGRFEERVVPLDSAARSAVKHLFETIDDALGQGFLPAAPEPEACDHCDYLAVCGPYEELRVQRKQPDRLIPLTRLREQP